MTVMILPTILIIILIITQMMLLLLLAVIVAHKDHNVLSDGTTMITGKLPKDLMTIFLTASPSSTSPYGASTFSNKKLGGRKKLRLQ